MKRLYFEDSDKSINFVIKSLSLDIAKYMLRLQ